MSFNWHKNSSEHLGVKVLVNMLGRLSLDIQEVMLLRLATILVIGRYVVTTLVLIQGHKVLICEIVLLHT